MGKIGFLDDCENKVLLANNFEKMVNYLESGESYVEEWEKKNEYESGVFETLIFPIIKRLTISLQVPLDPMYLENDITMMQYGAPLKRFIKDDYVRDEFEKLLKTNALWSVFSKSNQKSKIDTEAVACALISDYLTLIYKMIPDSL